MAAKILVVDDEPNIRELAQLILENEGYYVIAAANGVEAIQKATEEMPDLVLLDVVMPGVSGLDTCRVLKGDGRTRSIPVIMFTVLGRKSDREDAEEAGCDGYLIKPFSADSLLEEVKRHLKLEGKA